MTYIKGCESNLCGIYTDKLKTICNSLYFTLFLIVSTNVENTKHYNILNGCNDVRAFVYILTYWGTPVHAFLNPN